MKFLDFLKNYGSMIIWLVLLAVYFILWLVKKHKQGKLSITDLYDQIPELVANAEQLFDGAGKGAAKFAHVFTQLRMQALEAGFKKFDPVKVSNMIDKVVETSKCVNASPRVPKPLDLDKEDI